MKTLLALYIFLTAWPDSLFADSCKQSFKKNPAIKPKQGLENYESALYMEAADLLGREISLKEIEAVKQAGQTGQAYSADKRRSDPAQIKKKVNILKSAGFSKREIRALMENGLVWIRGIDRRKLLIQVLESGGENKEIPFLTSHFEQGWINQVVSVNEEGFEVSAEILEKPEASSGANGIAKINTGRLFIPKSTDNSGRNPHYIHPDVQSVFKAWKREREKISREDLAIGPFPRQEDQSGGQEGYEPFFIKGMDNLNEWVELRRRLKSLSAHPYKTHIPYFADRIEEHIAFAEQAPAGSFWNRVKRKIHLRRLKKSAREALEKERVTYYWWIEFNFQLSNMLSSMNYGSLGDTIHIDKKGVEYIISWFPSQIILPATEGELGIITLSRAYKEGIYPVGLINRIKTTDGLPKDPVLFLEHDMGHAHNALYRAIEEYSPGHRLQHKKMQALMEALPVEKRKPAEVVYFLSVHESGLNLLENSSRDSLRDALSQNMDIALKNGVFPIEVTGVTPEKYDSLLNFFAKVKYLKEHVVDIFMEEVYDKSF